jgi:thioredoxin 1
LNPTLYQPPKGTGASANWQTTEPTRAEIDAGSGPVLLEFGSPTCGYCRTAQPLVEQILREQGSVAQGMVRHLKIADAPGRALGRSFGVKLWPTLVFLRDGKEVARVVRPRELVPLRAAMARIVVA